MSENNREDILSDRLRYTHISLLSQKIRVLIVGGGRAGFIKARSFASKGCEVYVLSKEFICDFNHVLNMCNVSIIEGEYDSRFINDKHLIIIAISDDIVKEKIKKDCEKVFKLYLDCTDFKEGQFVMPMQRETNNISFSLNTKGGNPKAAVFLAEIVENTLSEYDEFIQYLCEMREAAKQSHQKEELLNFIATEEFKFFYDKGKHKEVLGLFFNK